MQIPGYEQFEQTGESPVVTFWQAYQTDLSRAVDIEILKPQAILDPTVRAEFLLNVRAAAGVKHAAIAQIYDIREMGTTLAVAREHLSGFSLQQWLRQKGPLKEEKSLTIARWVAEGLNFLYAKTGFCHLALSPDFVWLEPTGQVKVCGFGHHVLFEKLGRPLSEVGFLAPEQVAKDGAPCSFRTDIYALGGLLYWLTTGRIPFEDCSAAERPALILAGQVSAPVVLQRGSTSQAFNQLLHRMMAKDPEDRYNSWPALMQEMDRILDGAKYLIMTRRPVASTIQLPPNGMTRLKTQETEVRRMAQEASFWTWAGFGVMATLAVIFLYLLIRLWALPPPEERVAMEGDPAAEEKLSPSAAVPTLVPPSSRLSPREWAEQAVEADEESLREPVSEPREAVPVSPSSGLSAEIRPSGDPPGIKQGSLEELTDEVARRLLRGEVSTALMALDLALRGPEWIGQREKVEELRRVVRRAADPLGLALSELSRRQGRRVRVILAGRERELTVHKVENRRVIFTEEIRAEGAVASRPLIVEAGELPPAGLAGLLEAGEGAEFALARVILWHRAGQAEQACALVGATGLLAPALERHLQRTQR